MGKVEENKQNKKTRLMNTAFYLFTTKGFARTTIADIVHDADMAKGTFYLYFRDKYELQEKLIAWKAEELFRHAIHESGYEKLNDPTDQIIAVIDDIINQAQKNPALLRFINKNLSWGIFRRAIGQSDVAILPFFQKILPFEDPQELELVIYTIVEIVGSTCYSVILDQDPVDLDTYRPYLHRIIRGILTMPKNKEV